MKCSLEVCLSALAGVAILAGGTPGQTPALQKGISVQMALTTGGVQLPDADDRDAWVLTVTANGDLYWGADPVTPERLSETMESRPRNRRQELYIKADGRAPFSSVKRALETARDDGFGRVFLLTASPGGKPPGEVVPPFGLPLWVVSPPTSGGDELVVQIKPGQGSQAVKVENEEVPLRGLQNKIEQVLQSHSKRAVLLRVGKVSFADVVHVVDVCNTAGATTVIDLPGL